MTTKLIVIAAPSGAGKTTLCHRLLRKFPQLTLSISSTTRAPRGRERDGVEYFFIGREEFKKRIQQNGFAEWAEVHGNLYGTSREVIDKALAAGKSVLLDIDVQGAESLRQAYPNESYQIFIAPPSLDTLEARLRARKTDSEDTIRRRLANAKAEMERSGGFNKIIVNDDLERAFAELKALVAKQIGEPG